MNVTRCFMFVTLTIVAVLAAPADPPGIGLNPKFKVEDLEPILNNPRTLDSYIKCTLGEGPCTPDGTLFRKAFPLALQSACGACTETEKQIVKLSARHIYLNDPNVFKKVVEKFDKEQKYIEAFTEFITAED